jgi:hypothetical protein
MGTGDAHVTVAATLAGGSRNQDRFRVDGDSVSGFAIVLDGATAWSPTPGLLDAGKYAEVLAEAIASGVSDPASDTADGVADAISTVRDIHELTPGATPTSTIAIARWNREQVEVYVLGDSPVVILGPDGAERMVTDPRLGQVAAEHRTAYRAALAAGHGYGGKHAAALVAMQAEQARWRNRPDGYWIAGADPEAAHRAVRLTVPRAESMRIIVASDGVVPERHPTRTTWAGLTDAALARGAEPILRELHDAEVEDPDGRRWPRSKRHDDKTLIVAELG